MQEYDGMDAGLRTHDQLLIPLSVIIVGAGIAGCATALSIQRHDSTKQLRVLLIDNSDDTTFRVTIQLEYFWLLGILISMRSSDRRSAPSLSSAISRGASLYTPSAARTGHGGWSARDMHRQRVCLGELGDRGDVLYHEHVRFRVASRQTSLRRNATAHFWRCPPQGQVPWSPARGLR